MKFGFKENLLHGSKISKNSPRREGPRGKWLTLRASSPNKETQTSLNYGLNKYYTTLSYNTQYFYKDNY